MPWRVAFALQEDGWILRNAVVWHKPNAMPESVRDRLNCRHELIFLFVKQPSYWFDLDPIRVPHSHATRRKLRTRATRNRAVGVRGRGPTGETRPPKYGPHARAVVAGRRYGNLQHARSHRAMPSARSESWGRLGDPHAPLPGPALRRVPHRPAAALHRGRMQTGRRRCSTCSPGPPRPVSPPSGSAVTSPASSCRQSSPTARGGPAARRLNGPGGRPGMTPGTTKGLFRASQIAFAAVR